MEDYKPNSHLSKQKDDIPEKKVEKVVSGTVKQKKRSGLSKLAGEIIQEDGRNVTSYLLSDVLIPAFKKMVSDAVTNGVDMILYGETGRSDKKKTPASKVSYRSYYDDREDSRLNLRSRSEYDYDEIIFSNRGEAEEVLSRMDDLVDRYGTVSVADFYDLVGITGNYTDNKYGWTNIRNASVMRVREGYTIKLPRALPFD